VRGRSKIGVRTVGFRDRPDGLAVHTMIDLAVQVATFAPLDPREMVRAANRAPLHPGAERYYRERGWLP
jgi:hypothetical protein